MEQITAAEVGQAGSVGTGCQVEGEVDEVAELRSMVLGQVAYNSLN